MKRVKKSRKIKLPKPKKVKGKCVFCGNPATSDHHIVFKRYGGSSNPDNLVPMCGRCQQVYHELTDILLDYLNRK